MPLTIPQLQSMAPKPAIPGGGGPASDAAYLEWRDRILGEWSERLVARLWHSLDLDDLMPGWRFDELMTDRVIASDLPLFANTPSHLNYSHRLRLLSATLRHSRRRMESLAYEILSDLDGEAHR
jgi:hypothetical protein